MANKIREYVLRQTRELFFKIKNNFCFRKFHFVLRNVPPSPGAFLQNNNGILIHRIIHKNTNANDIENLFPNTKTARRRFSEGDRCHVSFLNDKAVSTAWIHYGNCFIKGAGLIIENKEVRPYLYGIYTVEEARRKGISTALIDFTDKELQKGGHENTLHLVESTNDIALKILLRSDAKIIQNILYVCVMGLKLSHIKDLSNDTSKTRIFFRCPKNYYII